MPLHINLLIKRTKRTGGFEAVAWALAVQAGLPPPRSPWWRRLLRKLR